MNHRINKRGLGRALLRWAKRLALLAVVPLAVGSIYGCNSSEAAPTTPGPGRQNSPWGVPYPNMPDYAPPQVRATEYGPVLASEVGPVIDAAKGYRIEDFGGGGYMVTEGAYQAMIVVSDVGVILVDAPPSIGAGLLKAVNDVAPGAKVVQLIYSHAHIDHIGYAAEIQKSNPSMTITAHEETRTTRWDFHLIAGHVGRAGTKADVAQQLAFMTDLHNTAYEGLVTIKPGETVNPKNADNVWAYYRDYVDQVTNHCVNKI